MSRSEKAVAAKERRKESSPGSKDGKFLLRCFREMLLIRRFEERAGQLYGMGLIGGFCHLYIGQEAVAVGVQSVLQDGDAVIGSYRVHGHMLSCGMDPKSVMSELTGRSGGCSRGKGGSMHMFSPNRNFYGGHGIVGAQVPIGAGLAFAARYRDSGAVSVVYFGDGAANQGQVYETFNMAGLWKLPIVFVIENNKYAMGTSIDRASLQTELFKRGDSFNIAGKLVDGMDVLAVREASRKAVEGVRSGAGPCILEMKTYRYRGHSMSDPAKYRKREEVEAVKASSDPIESARARLLKWGVSDEAGLKAVDAEVKAQIAEAVEFAQTLPQPDAQELWTDVVV